MQQLNVQQQFVQQKQTQPAPPGPAVEYQAMTKDGNFDEAEKAPMDGDEDKEFPLTPMGVLAPGSAHARPSARPPIGMSKNFPAKCLQSHLQTSPPTPQNSYPKFRNPRTTFEIFKKKL